MRTESESRLPGFRSWFSYSTGALAIKISVPQYPHLENGKDTAQRHCDIELDLGPEHPEFHIWTLLKEDLFIFRSEESG